MAITETSSSLTSGQRDTGSSAEEAAHLPDPTTTDDPPPETTTSTGIYLLMLKMDSFYSCYDSPVTIPMSDEVTSGIPPVASSETHHYTVL